MFHSTDAFFEIGSQTFLGARNALQTLTGLNDTKAASEILYFLFDHSLIDHPPVMSDAKPKHMVSDMISTFSNVRSDIDLVEFFRNISDGINAVLWLIQYPFNHWRSCLILSQCPGLWTFI
jgi:hypothetical protein